jgi:hypothetical protein
MSFIVAYCTHYPTTVVYQESVSDGTCLSSRCLAVDRYVTIYRERERERGVGAREVGRFGNKIFVAYFPGLPEEHHKEGTNSEQLPLVSNWSVKMNYETCRWKDFRRYYSSNV